VSDLRLYIAVTFWGEQYRRYFVDYCLASLLAPGNIPAIADKASARLLVATTEADWQAMQSEPVFRLALAHVRVEHIPYEVPDHETSRLQVMQAMSAGHRRLAERMFEDRAYGIFVYPDGILADGGIARLQDLALSGVKVVMCLAARFANEGLIGELQHHGLLSAGKPLVIDTVALAQMSIAHMHSETLRWNFDADVFYYSVYAFWWTVTPGQNMLFLAGNWAPMLLDYGSLAEHDTSAFDRWTLDGDYVYKNFTDPNDFYIVQSTSELFVTTITPENRVHHSLKPFLPYRVAWLRTLLKTRLAHHFLLKRGLFDPIKLEFFQRPIRMQGGDCSEAAWRQAEQRAVAVMRKVLSGRRSPFEVLVDFGIDCAFCIYRRLEPVIRRRGRS
jgi:hypothetical protein